MGKYSYWIINSNDKKYNQKIKFLEKHGISYDVKETGKPNMVKLTVYYTDGISAKQIKLVTDYWAKLNTEESCGCMRG